ncbi:hypothetical protein CSB37_03480 [bacterium DOLZORAL124_38_8]|nr:MAG: hypothetical protein CSB37_03480 [bacterium DOLZORAL124_38_8]
MNKLLTTLILSLCCVTQTWAVANTQNDVPDDAKPLILEPSKIIQPLIDGPTFVRQGVAVNFSGENSQILSEEVSPARFIWPQVNEQGLRFGKTVERKFQKLGKQTVLLKIKQGDQVRERTKEIFVYNKTGLFITSPNKNSEEIIHQAGAHGIYLKPIFIKDGQSGLVSEGKFLQNLSENAEALREANLIIFNIEYSKGLQNFAQWWNKKTPNIEAKNKLWVQLTGGSLKQISQLSETARKIIQPKSIIVTRFSALNTIFEQLGNPQIVQTLQKRGISFELVDGLNHKNPFLIFSNLTSYFVANGISANVIYLLLAVPFITFVIAFFRQFIGISTFGVFSPLMLTLSFLLLGFNFGFLSFLVVMVVGYMIRSIFKKVELLYIPRVSLLHSALAISFLPVLGLAVYFDTSINLVLAIFPLMVMATVSEKFVSAQSEGGLKKALISAGETVFVSLIAFALLKIPSISNTITSTPEIILLPVLGNVWLGKFTGLRLSEYVKFRTIFQNKGEDEQE